MWRWTIRGVQWLAIWALVCQLIGCSSPLSDEASLRQAVARMEKAAEAGQISPILELLDKQFLGNNMYRKANIQAMLLLYFRQNPHISVILHITRLQIQNETAQLACEVLLTGRDKQRLLPERAQTLVVDSLWHKHDGEWRVVRARWKNPLLQP